MKTINRLRTRISAARRRWLEEQTAAWRDEGLVDEFTRARILDRYDAESQERRATLMVIVLAVLMCGVGIALLVGYNWHRIPGTAKIVMLLASVAAAFGGSSWAYARGKATQGELLALAGTILFGNSIWLIAQVLHMSGRYPDAFLWFAVGAVVAAVLVRSPWISVLSACLAVAWVVVEGTYIVRFNPGFLALAPAVVVSAYRARVPLAVPIVALAAGLWAFLSGVDDSPAIAIATAALMACVFNAVARLRRDEFSEWWRLSGFALLGLALIPLLIEEFHADAVKDRPVELAVLVTGGAVALVALAASWRGGLRGAVERTMLIVAVVLTTWTPLHMYVLRPGAGPARVATALYSVLALTLGAALIRSAVRSSRLIDLAIGVAFALLVLIVRWAEAPENLLWSGLFLLAAGGGLLFVARLWQRRDRQAARGSTS